METIISPQICFWRKYPKSLSVLTLVLPRLKQEWCEGDGVGGGGRIEGGWLAKLTALIAGRINKNIKLTGFATEITLLPSPLEM